MEKGFIFVKHCHTTYSQQIATSLNVALTRKMTLLYNSQYKEVLLLYNFQTSDSSFVSLERKHLFLRDQRIEFYFRHLSCDSERDVVDENYVLGTPVELNREVDGGRGCGVEIDSTVKPDGVVFP